MARSQDPIQSRDDGSRDRYDVTTWEVRTPLDRVATWLYWVLDVIARWVLVLLAGAILVAIVVTSDLPRILNPVVSAFTVLSLVPALALVAYVWWTDSTTAEPLSLLAVTFALGVLFASFAAIINGLGSVLQLVPIVGPVWFFYLVVGPIEETMKWLAVRIYAYRSPRFDAVIDGAVYGAVAGLGFATIENAIYITDAVANPVIGNVLGAGGGVTPARAIAGPGHVIYSAFAGYYLGLAKFNRDRAGPIIVKGLLIAALIHATYNTLTFIPAAAAFVLGIPNFVTLLAFVIIYDSFFGYFLYRKLARYRRQYRATRQDGALVPVERTEFEE
ncbi:PrsW family intramembrane metalloprotease [Halococcus dombrowskii]|uniref:PrsW family intramembrane metalloprotease n=1 Tax=Halococcus dombrowskii TaxID=179637 RepID=A0AAV3SDT3_HALDO|nr:PrsW family intramembrane metalloprotease [Halococcus dombrowskii]UOO96144.1 PrsW family intramembrane metalloprotease [Halococcus dombrowskii]